MEQHLGGAKRGCIILSVAVLFDNINIGGAVSLRELNVVGDRIWWSQKSAELDVGGANRGVYIFNVILF